MAEAARQACDRTHDHKTHHIYSSITIRSTWSNDATYYHHITPITKETAWTGDSEYDEHDGDYSESNNLQLITSDGRPLRSIQTETMLLSLSQPNNRTVIWRFSW